MRRRSSNRRLLPDEISPYWARPPLWSGVGWKLSIAFGRVAVVLFGGILVFLLLGGTFDLREQLRPYLPESIVKFLVVKPQTSDTTVLTGTREAVGSAASEAAHAVRPLERHKPVRRFGMGSSMQEVLTIQGKPQSQSDTVWTYGDSQVYFLAGRVTGWRDSPGAPLKVQSAPGP